MSLPDPFLQREFYAYVPLKRAVAWGVDTVITLVLAVVALLFTLFVGALFFPVLFAAVSIAYRGVMLARYGATVGMMLSAIKLRHLDGRPVDQGTAFAYAGLHALIMTFILPQIASIAMILTTPYRQGLHDMLLGTTMLNAEAPED